MVIVLGESVRVKELSAISSLTVLELDAAKALPKLGPKLAVSEWLPSVSVLMGRVATPEAFTGEEPIWFPPSKKMIVPVGGVLAEDVTFAVIVTVCP